ncbi:MAG TPA: helix-turn-helix domain-containing protein [Methylomirabilota bacterium]|nr:helix-turn-helix domain-containing protein [Methylomirabilota bacterium]
MGARSGAERFEELVDSGLPSLVSEVASRGGPLYREVMARVEEPLLRHAVAVCGGNQLKAAKLLGINRNTLRRRLRLLGLLPGRGDRSGAGADSPPA